MNDTKEVEFLYPHLIAPVETEFEKILFNLADDYTITDTLDLDAKYHGAKYGWEIIDPTLEQYCQKTSYGTLQIKEATKYTAFIINHDHLDNVRNICKNEKIDFVMEKVLHNKGRKAASLLVIAND